MGGQKKEGWDLQTMGWFPIRRPNHRENPSFQASTADPARLWPLAGDLGQDISEIASWRNHKIPKGPGDTH